MDYPRGLLALTAWEMRLAILEVSFYSLREWASLLKSRKPGTLLKDTKG